MKYWLFDGNDIIGPFSPEELAARAEFSAASLVAPDGESEDQHAWKTASSFEEFQWDENTGALKIVPPQAEQPSVSALPTQAPQDSLPATQEPLPARAPALKVPEKQTPVPLAKPIVLAEGTDDIISLPVHEEPAAKDEDPFSPSVQETQEPASTDEIFPAHNEQIAAADEPSADDVSTTDEPEEFTIWQEPEQTQVTQEAQSNESAKKTSEHTQELVMPRAVHPDLLNHTERLTEPENGERKVLKPHLPKTPEIDTFLEQQKESHRPGRRRARWMLWILCILLIPGIVAILVHRKEQPPQTPAQPQAEQMEPIQESQEPEPEKPIAQKSVVQTLVQEPVIPAPPPIVPQAVPAPAQPTLSEQAVEIVKNHTLSGNRGTVSSYLNKLYQTQLSSGGYLGEWSAEPLHKSIYIVKYRLTKTRTEPIVYVFQADVSKGNVIGALNNITLDLVGKI